MNLNPKAKQILKRLFTKLEENSFDENDIVHILRYLRPYENKNSLIWEFACFVAHTEERTQGFIHKELDLNYAKLIYFPGFQTTASDDFNVLKIEKKLFKILLEIGLNDFPDKDFKIKTGVNKIQAKKIIKESYEYDNGYYYIRKISYIRNIYIIADCIYSYVNFRLAIKNEILIRHLYTALIKANKYLQTNFDFRTIILNNSKDILLCFMSIINHHQFKLFDNTLGKAEIDFTQYYNGPEKKNLKLMAKISLGTTKFNWPIMSLENMDGYISDCRNSEDYLSLTANRIKNGKLILNSE